MSQRDLLKNQIWIFLITYLSIAARHISIQSWAMCKPEIRDDLNMNSTWLGTLDFTFLFCYAIGNFISGTLSDKFSPSKIASIGVGLGGIMYLICVILGSFKINNPWIFSILFAFEGIFQSAAWPSSVSIMGNWFPKANTGKIIGFWSSNAAAGHLIGAQLSAFMIYNQVGWKIIISICAFFMVFIALLLWIFGKDKPEISLESSTPLLLDTNLDIKKEPKKKITFWQAWLLPGVINYSLSFASVKTLNYAILLWLPYYLHDDYKLESNSIGIMANLYDAASLIGVFIFGWVTDKLGSRGPTLCVIMFSTLPVIWGFEAVPINMWWIFYFLSFMIGILAGAAGQLIPGAVSVDIGRHDSDKSCEKALSTVAGIIDGTGSLGAAFGQILIGYLASFDWMYSFIFMLIAGFISFALLLPIGVRECTNKKITGKKYNI